MNHAVVHSIFHTVALRESIRLGSDVPQLSSSSAPGAPSPLREDIPSIPANSAIISRASQPVCSIHACKCLPDQADPFRRVVGGTIKVRTGEGSVRLA